MGNQLIRYRVLWVLVGSPEDLREPEISIPLASRSYCAALKTPGNQSLHINPLECLSFDVLLFSVTPRDRCSHPNQMTGLLTALDIGLGIVGLLIMRQLYSRKHIAPLPPGPRSWPLLGNLFDVPSAKEWVTFASWGEKWGEWPFGQIFTS